MRTNLLISCLILGIVISTVKSDFLTKSLNRCINADAWTPCLKHEFLEYLDEKLGTTTEARSLENLDEAIVSRTFKYLRSFEYGTDLPLIGVKLKYKPGRALADLDVEFEGDQEASIQARGLLKKKLLLPMLLLLKLKLKALMPIFVAIIGFKALKALILSKLAIIIVIGFVASQFLKKGGMMPPMGMTMDPTPPTPVYGAPPLTTTTSGYEPPNTWDSNGPYSRVWTPNNGIEPQNLAYNYYSGGSSNSYGGSSSSSPSGSSSSSSSSITGNSNNSPTYTHSRRK